MTVHTEGPAAEVPFPVGRFLSSLVALAAAIALGDYVLYPAGASPLVILAPRILVVLAFGAGLRTFRQVLGFGWGASVVVVAFRFVPAMLVPSSAAAQVPEGAGARFWIAGLVFWWSAFSLLYALGMLTGHVIRVRGGTCGPSPDNPSRASVGSAKPSLPPEGPSGARPGSARPSA